MTMRNKFAGTCRRCQLLVPAGEGVLLKDERDRWVVQCDAAGGCFCRKALSDERSTAVGYGKTCSQNWLKWGARPAEFAASAA